MDKKTKKKHFLWVFLGGFLGFFWVGFLMPTLVDSHLCTVQFNKKPWSSTRGIESQKRWGRPWLY
jgi:hypothetical protein